MRPKIPLDIQDIERINQAVVQSAASTSVRIVPVVAKNSGRYERAEDLVGLWAAAIALAAILAFFLEVPFGKTIPSNGSIWRLGILPVLVVITGGFAGGAMIVTHMAWLRRLFVPPKQLHANVKHRARMVFNEYRSRDPKPLLLVFVSVYEGDCCLVPDEVLQEQLDTPTLESIRALLMASLKEGNLESALRQAVARLAAALAVAFPANDGSDSQEPEPLAVM